MEESFRRMLVEAGLERELPETVRGAFKSFVGDYRRLYGHSADYAARAAVRAIVEQFYRLTPTAGVHSIAAAIGMSMPQTGDVSVLYVEAIRQLEGMARGMLLPNEPIPQIGVQAAKVYARLHGGNSTAFLGKQLDQWYRDFRVWLPMSDAEALNMNVFMCFRNSGFAIPAEIKEIYDREWERQATRRRKAR